MNIGIDAERADDDAAFPGFPYIEITHVPPGREPPSPTGIPRWRQFGER